MYYSTSSSNLTSTYARTSLVFSDPTFSTPLSLFDDNITLNSTFSSFLLIDQTSLLKNASLSCNENKQQYLMQKPIFNMIRYISHNLNRFFLLPSIILNLCAFYILRRTRMNRSSSIAFYMQTLAICDVAFFALRIIFEELSRSQAGRQILTNGLCKFLFLMVNAVNYTTVWLIAAMNADKFLAVCLPLRVSDLLSRKKAYAVVLAVIICSMLVASVHASKTIKTNDGYCWLRTSKDIKLVFILDAFFWCFIPFVVISVLNAAIFIALFRARREASQLHETTKTTTTANVSTPSASRSIVQSSSTNGRISTTSYLKTPTNSSMKKQFRASTNTNTSNRTRIQSQNLQITIMLITISISFFVLTLPNAIYYLLIFLRVVIEHWSVVQCDGNEYRNLDKYVRTSAVVYFISNITSDLMHVVNFFLYFISGARFRAEFRRLIFSQICRWCCRDKEKMLKKDFAGNERSFIRSSGVAAVRSLASLPTAGIKQSRTSNLSYSTTIRDKQKVKQAIVRLSSNPNVPLDENISTVLEGNRKRSQCVTPALIISADKNDKSSESNGLLSSE